MLGGQAMGNRQADYTLTPDRDRFPWLPEEFDMRLYGGLVGLDWHQWWVLLGHRRRLRDCYRVHGEEGLDVIKAMMEYPLNTVDGHISKLDTPAVSPVTLGDAPEFINTIKRTMGWIQPGDPLSDPLPLPGTRNAVFTINTLAPHSVIMAELKKYLGKDPRPKGARKARDYYRLGILPFIDLILWCEVTRQDIARTEIFKAIGYLELDDTYDPNDGKGHAAALRLIDSPDTKWFNEVNPFPNSAQRMIEAHTMLHPDRK